MLELRDKGYTLRAIGAELDLAGEWVRQIERQDADGDGFHGIWSVPPRLRRAAVLLERSRVLVAFAAAEGPARSA